jgi:hypothetical protein
VSDIPSRCVRRVNEHHVCNCDCEGYERKLAAQREELADLHEEHDKTAELLAGPVGTSGEWRSMDTAAWAEDRMAEIAAKDARIRQLEAWVDQATRRLREALEIRTPYEGGGNCMSLHGMLYAAERRPARDAARIAALEALLRRWLELQVQRGARYEEPTPAERALIVDTGAAL